MVYQVTLTEADNASIAPVVDALARTYDTIEDPDLIRRARLLCHRLPSRLLESLEEFRLGEPSAICLLSGFIVDQDALGPTPAHWHDSHWNSPTFRHEIFFLLCASALGDVFGWSTQQHGRIMHDVLPIQGHEHHEIGTNSLQHLSWHTEDAFHPCRGDYVALMCLRNPDLVETVVCAVPDIDWAGIDAPALFEPEFTVMPDNSHQPESDVATTGDPEVDRLKAKTFALIEQWSRTPEKRPILFGDPRDPYLALDPYHMNAEGWPNRSRRAFRQLCDAIEAQLRPIALRPGDCVFIDNFRAVHGRKSFRAHYDGSDRWLKRLNITRNLRGSRAWRPAADNRIIH